MKRRKAILLVSALLFSATLVVIVTDWMMVRRLEAAAATLKPGDPQALAETTLGSTAYGADVVAGYRRVSADWYYAGPIAHAQLYLAELSRGRDWESLAYRLEPPIRVVVERENGKIRRVVFGPVEPYMPSTNN